MKLGKLGVFCFLEAMRAPETAAFAKRIEDLGYAALWFPEAVGREALSCASWLLSSTKKLVVATGIANVYARDAMTMAAGRNTLAEQSGGRFILGIGVSHQPMVEGLRGHAYTKPLTYMTSYLDAMSRALYVAPLPAEPAPIVIGALHPKMLALAAAKTAGAHPYLVPPEHTAFARETMGKGPWICTEQKVVLSTDAATARAAARTSLAMYLELPNYRRSLKRFGITDDDFAAGGSDRLVDTVVAWGDEKAIDARIRAHIDAGADHVCIQPLNPDGTLAPDWRVLEAFAPAKRS
jgi:probable F420-dependent oxidoreductase